MTAPHRSLATLVFLSLTLAAAAQMGDDFNRPDSTIVAGWTEVSGDWQILNQQLHAQATSSWQIITFDPSAGSTDGTLTSELYYPASPGVTFIGHVHRYNSTSSMVHIKVQDNTSNGDYDRVFFYENQGAGSVGYFDLTTPTTSAILQTELVGTQLTIRVDTDMDLVWDDTRTYTTGITGPGHEGVCGYRGGILDNYNLAGGPTGPAVLEVNTVDAVPTTVTQGDTGIQVSVTVDNTGVADATTLTGTLSFTGSADRTSEYTVVPDPANPTTIAPAGTETLIFTVDVSPTATLETITIDAQAHATDAFAGAPIDDLDAAVTDSWDVLYNCLAVVCGDCNGDGTVSILDALVAAQHAAGLIALTAAGFSSCNVLGLVEPDPGAAVDVLDALTIAQFSAGLTASLVCC